MYNSLETNSVVAFLQVPNDSWSHQLATLSYTFIHHVHTVLSTL